MTLEELKEALLAADPAAVLVPGHLLARVVREVHELPAQVIHVPHRKSCILDRAVLRLHTDQDDLDLGPDRLLPEKVILLARPALDRRNTLERETTLRLYWRRLFHAGVHVQLEALAAKGQLDPQAVAERITRIGSTEFAEAQAVLAQEGYLFPNATPRDVYIEFAALYLEFRLFLPDLLPVYFPAIRDHERVEAVLAADVDAKALFERTRLGGVPGPAPRPDMSADEPTEACFQLMREARRASRAGNNVRAAILRTRAARIAPAALTVRLRGEVEADLEQLTERLRDALKLTEAERLEWRKDLPPLVDKSGEGQWSAEARLLYDLQNACIDHEREVYTLDLVEWALSGGKRPIKRPLTGQRVVRITKHLRSAAGRLTSTRLAEADRQHLGQLLLKALQENEDRLRARFRPVLVESLRDVGLAASNPPEQAAFAKMVEELLDRISELGFFTFSDLRDAISRNNLKLPDLADPVELVRGDPLLRLDRLLASSPLDGVYRPSEIYLRVMQRLTAPNFGTRLGRSLTRYVTLPFGTALLGLEGIDLIRREAYRLLPDSILGGVYQSLYGPISVLLDVFLPAQQPETTAKPARGAEAFLAPSLWVLLGFVILALMYLPGVRRALWATALRGYRACRHILVEWPLSAVPWPVLKACLKSWPVQLVYRLVLKPLPMFLLLFWLIPGPVSVGVWVLLFIAVVVILNSRPMRGLEDAAARGLAQLWTWFRAGLINGLFRLIVQLFKGITDGLEYVLYTIDEWLRFRTGDSRLSMVIRAVLGVIWFPVSYITRLYIVVLIEPGFNPLKAPISIVAAKFVYPILLTVTFTQHLTALLEPVLGAVLAYAVAYITWWLMPDAFGFLFWEMKENWRLYRANRAQMLEPARVGPHGETMLQLLKPGFHSGTLPKLFAQQRKAERAALQTGAWRPARAGRERLRNVEELVRRFVARDVLALLHLSPEWQKKPLSVGAVTLASNLVRIELRHADYPAVPLGLTIAERGGLLLARVEDPGWLERLSPTEARTLDIALAGLYKLAGVDVVSAPPARPPVEAICELPAVKPELTAGIDGSNGVAGAHAPCFPFRRVPLTWSQWVEWWRLDGAGEPPAATLGVLPAVGNGSEAIKGI